MVAERGALTDILPRLFRTPPPEFVAERNRVAKALRTDGDKDLAGTVAAVRRPGLTDWALNVAADDHRDEVAELVEAANEVIDAQEAAMVGRDGGDLRVRLKLVRVCAATVAQLATDIAGRSGQTGRGSSIPDITTRLNEIAANRGALALFERGLLGAEDPGSADPFAADAGADEVTARGRRRERPATTKRPTSARTPEPPAGPTAAERKQRRAAVTAANKALVAAESAAKAAEQAVATRQRAAAKAQERVTQAEAQLAAAREALADQADHPGLCQDARRQPSRILT